MTDSRVTNVTFALLGFQVGDRVVVADRSRLRFIDDDVVSLIRGQHGTVLVIDNNDNSVLVRLDHAPHKNNAMDNGWWLGQKDLVLEPVEVE